MKRTILLIDDCDMMRRFLAPIFKEDYNVVPMGSAMDALDWLQQNPVPTAILLDYQLPDIPGIDLLRRLRKNNAWNNVPVLMLSGVKDMERRWQCIEAGANDFLSKPFHPKELSLRVNMIAQKAPQNAQTTALPLTGGGGLTWG